MIYLKDKKTAWIQLKGFNFIQAFYHTTDLVFNVILLLQISLYYSSLM